MIKLFVMDVDGTLTNGAICISGSGELFKSFNVKDGFALSNIINVGCSTCIITSRQSEIVSMRSKELKISYVFQGVSSKADTLKTLIETLGISENEVAYIGDDLNDIECIKLVGYSSCPRDAYSEIKPLVNYVCSSDGGKGAVREFVDYLVKMGEIPNYYDY